MSAPEVRSDATVWVVRAGSRGVDADLFVDAGVIAMGSEPIDLTGCDTRDDIERVVSAYDGPTTRQTAGNLHRFRNAIQNGDVVVVPVQSTRELLWGVVAGDYEFRSDPLPGSDPGTQASYHQARATSWSPERRSRDDLPQSILYSLGGLLTIFQPSGQDELREFLVSGVTHGVPATGIGADSGKPASSAARDAAEDAAAAGVSVDDQRSRNKELIQQHISRLGAYDVQDVVAGILDALGYKTEVAEPGPDGGIDIRAARDPLFIEPPVIKVQVKARAGTTGRPDIQQLNGVMDAADYGIFVSTGGFTAQAKSEARAFPRIQLWDMDRLVDLLLDHYGNVSAGLRTLVPLEQIWVLATHGD